MEITNTWQFKDKSIKELSGGERQRVYIARALAQKLEFYSWMSQFLTLI
ncbi:hypothetical protein TheetDRAFT_3034 [Thermoanaerobacter ethanolicus JW 200]|nr:hypothetical protein TheetDRAFT_3034 [Thermoanaerobacter ethanolicus JW 200]